MSYKFLFLRDAKRAPIGCLAFNEEKGQTTIQYQISMVHPIDKINFANLHHAKFDREHAKNLALGRLITQPFTIAIQSSEGLTRRSLLKLVMKDLIENSQAPTSAKRSARLWLKFEVNFPHGVIGVSKQVSI